MFASQLLRILQTIPSDVKCESCVYDSAEQDITMKENQNETLYDSQSLERQVDPLAFGSKQIYIRDSNPLVFDAKGRDDCWKLNFVEDFSMDNENGTRDSTGKEFQHGSLCHPSSLEEDADSLSSETNTTDKEHGCPTTVEEFTHCNQNEYIDSRSPCTTALGLSETDTELYADKNILEFEQPEIIVCYKEINYHVVKDICIDEGMAVHSKSLIESSKDEQARNSFSQPLSDDNHSQVTEGGADMEFFVPDGLATSSLDNTEGVRANEHGNKEESEGKLLAQERPKLPSENSFDKDAAKSCYPVGSIQKGETNFGSTDKTLSDASKEDSFIDRALPIQEFGTRSFLRSFLNSLGSEDNKVAQLQNQISSGKAVSGCPAAFSAEAGPMEDVQASSLYFNSKVESGSITFNFNSPAPEVTDATNGSTKNVEEQSVDSRNLLDHRDADARQVHCNGSKDTSIGEVHEQSVNIEDGFSSDFSATSQAQSVIGEDVSDNKVHDQSPDLKDKKSDDPSSSELLQFASSKSVNSMNSEGQAVDSHFLKHEHMETVNGSDVVSEGKYDEGETSFSAAGLITYSGPIAFSGSLSLRSDGSTTSARSFAFPVLQPEWNTSPVRMSKAEGRHFRKHRGWRSGLLCCRF